MQYLPRPERGGGRVLFFQGPWPGLLERPWYVAPFSFGRPAMSELQGLVEVVRELAVKARRLQEQYRDRRLGEENTKAALIAPLLEALGWNISDPDEVHHEYRHTPRDNPVDYCLKLDRSPKLLVEAKGLGEDLADHRWIGQTLGYAVMTGAEWCLLTDGDEYRLYNATAPVEADQKLLCKVRLSDGGEDEAVKVFNLISRSNMSGPRLKDSWQRYHADRRVKSSLREIVDAADRKLVLLIRRRVADLSSKEIAASIRRLNIKIDAAESPFESDSPRIPTPPKQFARARKRELGDASLADLISARILAAPQDLFRKYKGKMLKATLLANGTVELQGQCYDTCSAAAAAARKSLTGRQQNTNGWTFWQYQAADGVTRTLAGAREQLVRSTAK